MSSGGEYWDLRQRIREIDDASYPRSLARRVLDLENRLGALEATVPRTATAREKRVANLLKRMSGGTLHGDLALEQARQILAAADGTDSW